LSRLVETSASVEVDAEPIGPPATDAAFEMPAGLLDTDA
jgi:hypothetical protein